MWKTPLTRGWILLMLGKASAVFAEECVDQICNPISAKSFPELVQALSKAAIQIVLPIAVIAIIYAGLRFVIAGAQGNDGEIRSARKMLLWIVVGTAVVVGSAALAEAAVNLLKNL